MVMNLVLLPFCDTLGELRSRNLALEKHTYIVIMRNRLLIGLLHLSMALPNCNRHHNACKYHANDTDNN